MTSAALVVSTVPVLLLLVLLLVLEVVLNLVTGKSSSHCTKHTMPCSCTTNSSNYGAAKGT